MYRNVPTTPADKSIPRDYIEREAEYAYVELDRKTGAVLQSIKEDAKPCRECGELCESQWSTLCRPCQFKLSEAVKASRKIIRSAKRHGNPVVSVWDGEDTIKGNERELLEAVHSVDFSRLTLQSGAWVAVICGEETEADCIPDYSLSIENIVDDANLRED